jgi:hypothetical protein
MENNIVQESVGPMTMFNGAGKMLLQFLCDLNGAV